MLALLASSWALVGLIDGSGWWWLLIGVGTLLLVAPAVLRTLGVPRLLASLLDLVLLCLVLDAGFGHPLLGLIPTPDSLSRFAVLLDNAGDVVLREAVPAAPRPELMLLVAGIGGLVALLLDLAAVTLPALVGVILLAVVAVPGFFIPQGIDLAALAGCVLAYLGVLWASGTVRLPGRSAGVAAAVIGGSTVIALGVTLLAPGLQQTWWKDPGLSSANRGASSLIDLGNDLRASSPAEILSYTTDRTPAPYLQLATLEDYDGTTWVHRDGPQAAFPTGRSPGLGAPGLANAIPTTTYDTSIEVEGLSAQWAPAPYPAQAVRGASGDWSYDANDLSLTISGASLGTEQYTVRSLDIPAEAVDDLPSIEAAGLPDDVRADLQLPPSMPELITDTANQVAGGETTEIGEARALQDYLRESGGFRYSTETPDAASEDGMEVIASFLERKSGYCIHFASAMTVMARVLGIPARIAIGYLPGMPHYDSTDGLVHYSESNQQLHAWPQLFFPGVGWLDFEPTVGQGDPADYTRAPGTAADPTAAPTTGPSASASPSQTPTTDPSEQAEPTPDGTDSTQSPSAGAARNSGWVIALVVILAILVAPMTLRRIRRRRRMRQLATGGPPGIAWAEVQDTARDVGMSADSAETPRAFAARLSRDWTPEERIELDALLHAVEQATFGPAGGGSTSATDLPRLTTLVIRRIEESSSRGSRILAFLLPRSLLRI